MFHTFRMNKLNVGVTDKARGEAYFSDNEKIDKVFQVLRKFVPQQIAVEKAKGLQEGVSVTAPLRQVNTADRVEFGPSVTRDDYLFVDKDAASVAPSRGGAGSEGDTVTEDAPPETIASKGASGRKRMRSDLADGHTLQKRVAAPAHLAVPHRRGSQAPSDVSGRALDAGTGKGTGKAGGGRSRGRRSSVGSGVLAVPLAAQVEVEEGRSGPLQVGVTSKQLEELLRKQGEEFGRSLEALEQRQQSALDRRLELERASLETLVPQVPASEEPRPAPAASATPTAEQGTEGGARGSEGVQMVPPLPSLISSPEAVRQGVPQAQQPEELLLAQHLQQLPQSQSQVHQVLQPQQFQQVLPPQQLQQPQQPLQLQQLPQPPSQRSTGAAAPAAATAAAAPAAAATPAAPVSASTGAAAPAAATAAAAPAAAATLAAPAAAATLAAPVSASTGASLEIVCLTKSAI
ncbi:hypothetical protein CYMTET_46317 [Cymbomonas tetramitiformis]|uniref:Uncharacterized protein n=1 Tax=Cymbomonas tetramitiformis TaxID=36881 RepID=A0AAE0EXR0_9CHLO|nr:hypothetical protein CYMTET_46317 [Cymbomonas tetramitiformis]